jgi:CRISPR-associated protein (TIGR03984 family)
MVINKGFVHLGYNNQIQPDLSEADKGEVAENDTALVQLLDEKAKILASAQFSFVWLLVYFDHKVIWGHYQANKLEFADPNEKLEAKYLQELRLFGRKGELYLRRKGNNFSWRLRLDPDIEPTPPESGKNSWEKKGYKLPSGNIEPNYADEWQVLWGTKYDPKTATNVPNWTTITEDRGMKLTLPHVIASDDNLPIRLLVRHYLKYDNNGLCYYADTRMVELRDKRFNSF